MVEFINRVAGYGWKSRCSNQLDLTYATVFNVIKGNSTNKEVIKWIIDEYKECQEVDRLINDK